ncbi:NADH-quinone oxidoreductase subunit M [Gordonia polyisoprenivorans]|uniref:NADH-quinone oxidoreductase subunit M n=1 Tax=Gordonia polyisoprenivorans TaxID=84595 RepID=UPI001AD62D7B|nr:NADH-quinone oxidoreductase subunit M [Gordonia polyisoprenivorans]QTI69279.1 NADH-quinone oxidoreductase subunit M [Gordonia polyisoprenivorans]
MGWLTILWLIPAVVAVGVLAIPAQRPDLAKWAGLLGTAAALVVSVGLAIAFDPGGPRYQFVTNVRWIPSFGARYELGLDGIGLVLILLTTVLMPILVLAGWRDADHAGSLDHSGGRRQKGPHTYFALMLAVEAMVLMSFVATDVLLFYIVFEAMLIPMYFLIGGFGSGGMQAAAAVKFLLYNLFGGLLMLAAVIGLYVVTARSGIGADGRGTFSLPAISDAVAGGRLDASAGVLALLFGGFMIAFAIKAPLWPFHSWLPDSAVAATPASAVLMMAVVDKVGTFAMLRFCLQLFPEASKTFAPLIIALSVIGIVYGAILAIAQTDMMRLIAYTSISHFGFIILGVFAMTSESQSGATLYMVNHGISTAALFLIAGFLVSRRGSRLIADYGGVAKVAPVLAGTFLVAGLATLSLPGLSPFISEFLVFIGTFTRYPVAAIAASSALVLSAIYILWLYQRVMGGPPTPVEGPGAARRTMPDLHGRERLVVAPLLALLLVFGFFPQPLLNLITPTVSHTLTTVGRDDPAPAVVVPSTGGGK